MRLSWHCSTLICINVNVQRFRLRDIGLCLVSEELGRDRSGFVSIIAV